MEWVKAEATAIQQPAGPALLCILRVEEKRGGGAEKGGWGRRVSVAWRSIILNWRSFHESTRRRPLFFSRET